MWLGSKRRAIERSLADKGYRHQLNFEWRKQRLARQIHSLREGRGWSQDQLGRMIGLDALQIALLEDQDLDAEIDITTLRALAIVFDVALLIHFEPFSELVDQMITLSSANLSIMPYEDLLHGEKEA